MRKSTHSTAARKQSAFEKIVEQIDDALAGLNPQILSSDELPHHYEPHPCGLVDMAERFCRPTLVLKGEWPALSSVFHEQRLNPADYLFVDLLAKEAYHRSPVAMEWYGLIPGRQLASVPDTRTFLHDIVAPLMGTREDQFSMPGHFYCCPMLDEKGELYKLLVALGVFALQSEWVAYQSVYFELANPRAFDDLDVYVQ